MTLGTSQYAYALIQEVLSEQRALGMDALRLASTLSEQNERLEQRLTDLLHLVADAAPTPAAPPASARVTVSCLGTFTVVVDDKLIENWRAGKTRTLFQYLVLHRAQTVSRDTLIEALWPDPDALAAASSLKVAVHALRQTLRGTGDTDAPALTIVPHEASYQLSAPDLWLDVDEFERLCALGTRLEATQPEQALALFARAADLYRGDLLADVWDDWVLIPREALKDQYLLILGHLADAALASADYAACVRRCRQILEHDRCREDAFRTLMLCHGRLGQPSRVRRWFELCELTLRNGLDVAPEPATLRVFEAAMHGRD